MNQLDTKFGEFGGMYVPELLIPALDQLEAAFLDAKDDPSFEKEFMALLKDFAGRPTSMTLTRNLVSNPKVKLYLKRSGFTDQAYGQKRNHCGDGRGPARCSDGAGMRAVRSESAYLYGGQRCRASVSQCVSYAPDGR
ncbi:hypothetical protein GCM10007391_04560 [Alteromonas halophila]|uniref:Tryptophan synthase subunit beta n=1 Tax=Alteromonas halophila TaxID=516698 RepID=A0A918JD29_9ALTE|nr:hypothetical protein GCM10007391_04560 [Alteromonas halophila]